VVYGAARLGGAAERLFVRSLQSHHLVEEITDGDLERWVDLLESYQRVCERSGHNPAQRSCAHRRAGCQQR
jgi:hypothetical protein